MNHKLKEGDIHTFIIANELDIPNEREYYVLQGEWKKKYLLPKSFYTNYGFKIGQSIKCKIDKINCTGKVFLEPEHPVYKEGGVYEFALKGAGSIKNSLGKTEKVLIVKDVFSNEIKIPLHLSESFISGQKNISCTVLGIKKSKLLLSLLTSSDNDSLEQGQIYEFLISGITTLSDGNEYYVLKDENGRIHNLRKKYYENYGYQINQSIRCEVYKESVSTRVYLEPEHPIYRIGEIYDFKQVKVQRVRTFNGEEIVEVTVQDDYKNEIKFTMDDDSLLRRFPKQIKCKLRDIRKGRLFLEYTK